MISIKQIQTFEKDINTLALETRRRRLEELIMDASRKLDVWYDEYKEVIEELKGGTNG